MKEILPGIFHWTALHPGIKVDVSSYFLAEEGVLIDPILPPTRLDSFSPPPRKILLTNRHHYHYSGPIADRSSIFRGSTIQSVSTLLSWMRQTFS